MSEISLKFRWAIIIVATLLAMLWVAPNFMSFGEGSFLNKSKMVLGLDIQGGLHIVMGVDVEGYLKDQVAITARELEARFKEDGVKTQSVQVIGDKKDQIEVQLISTADRDAAVKYINDFRGSELQVLENANQKLVLRFFDAQILERQKQVVGQAIEVIRNRVDEFGTLEPSITAQGANRILVQLPGIKDAAQAKELINRTAKLTFLKVSEELPAPKLSELISEAETKGKYKLGGEGGLTYSAYVKRLNDDLQKELPKDTRIVFEKADGAINMEAGRQPFLVTTVTELNGGHLETARVSPDEFGKPEVNFRFKPEGRRLFAELTAKASGGLIAIVLDDVVKSAPSVRETIDSESARITLGSSRDYNSTLNEATFIATALRAGALPASLEQLEERTVGPSLGSDSIKKGQTAAAIGAIFVIVFMIVLYRIPGAIADIGIILNLLIVFAVLSSLNATLTLPGVAGVALTIGMTVDSNVIIYERIKEEFAKGASAAAAIRDGYANAVASILDSNFTAILTCFVLMYYGTGPIRGFAVSLVIGITTSMFTSIFVTRTIIDTLTRMNFNLFKHRQVY